MSEAIVHKVPIKHKLTDIINNLTEGLVLHLPLDEDSGTDACDYSGLMNHGVINGASSVVGKFGKALSFDGENDGVDCGNGLSLRITDAITISMWIKAEYVAFYQFMLSKGNGIDMGYELFLWDNGLVLFDGFYNASEKFYLFGTTDLRDGNWHHVVGTYDKNAATAKIYVDSVFQSQETHEEGITDSGTTLKIGSRTGWAYFKGIIDEVRIYNRALSQAEITALYNLP